jgi:hypothetical protein
MIFRWYSPEVDAFKKGFIVFFRLELCLLLVVIVVAEDGVEKF